MTQKTIQRVMLLIVVQLSVLMIIPETINAKQDPPDWAPAHGYRAKTRHIYFPEHNFYFDTQKEVYIYTDGQHWSVSVNLPSIFGNIDLKVASKVQIGLNSDTPQDYNSDHIEQYRSKSKEQHIKNSKTPKKNNGHNKSAQHHNK